MLCQHGWASSSLLPLSAYIFSPPPLPHLQQRKIPQLKDLCRILQMQRSDPGVGADGGRVPREIQGSEFSLLGDGVIVDLMGDTRRLLVSQAIGRGLSSIRLEFVP